MSNQENPRRLLLLSMKKLPVPTGLPPDGQNVPINNGKAEKKIKEVPSPKPEVRSDMLQKVEVTPPKADLGSRELPLPEIVVESQEVLVKIQNLIGESHYFSYDTGIILSRDKIVAKLDIYESALLALTIIHDDRKLTLGEAKNLMFGESTFNLEALLETVMDSYYSLRKKLKKANLTYLENADEYKIS